MGTAALLGSRAIRGMFFKRLEETSMASWAPAIAHMFDSDQASETYGFLGQVPSLRAWRGARRKTEPKDFSITVVNDEYEGTIEIARRDLRRDKTGQVQARIGDLATRAAQLPQKVLTTILEANAAAYDGIAYFGDHSASRGVRVNNALTDSSVSAATAPTSAEMTSGILALVQRINSATDDQGEPLNEFAREFLIMVPTLYLPAAVAAVQNEFTSAGVSNTLNTMSKGGRVSIRIESNPRLTVPTSTGIFYGFRTDADVKPLIWQDEVETDLDELGEGSDWAFDNNSHKYGVQRVGAGAGGEYGMAARMTFS
jgi:phage major head subunit gpT-like protein